MRLSACFNLPPDPDRDGLLTQTLMRQNWTVEELDEAERFICDDADLSRDAKYSITPALFASARQRIRDNARKSAPDRPSCRRCLHRPEGIAGSGVCRECWDELDKERADAELASAKPMEWK